MLTASAIGMAIYGLHEIVMGVRAAFGSTLEWWAVAALLLFGALLMLSAALVRVSFPGGLAAAIGSLLALQALALHSGVHLPAGSPSVVPHVVRAIVSIVLIGLGWVGGFPSKAGRPTPEPVRHTADTGRPHNGD